MEYIEHKAFNNLTAEDFKFIDSFMRRYSVRSGQGYAIIFATLLSNYKEAAKGVEDNRKLQRTKRQLGSPRGGARRPTSPRISLIERKSRKPRGRMTFWEKIAR
jgi:hypothetical protein